MYRGIGHRGTSPYYNMIILMEIPRVRLGTMRTCVDGALRW